MRRAGKSRLLRQILHGPNACRVLLEACATCRVCCFACTRCAAVAVPPCAVLAVPHSVLPLPCHCAQARLLRSEGGLGGVLAKDQIRWAAVTDQAGGWCKIGWAAVADQVACCGMLWQIRWAAVADQVACCGISGGRLRLQARGARGEHGSRRVCAAGAAQPPHSSLTPVAVRACRRHLGGPRLSHRWGGGG